MTHTEYIQDFIKKHSKSDWQVITSYLTEDGGYTKTYVFDDGATLTEVNRPVYEKVEVKTTVKGIPVVISDYVKLFESECWNTDNAKSVKFYERW